VGIKYGKDGENVSMSVAAKTAAGKIFVEAIDCRPIRGGDNWMLKFLKAADVAQVIIDGASGQQLMKEQMHEAKIKLIPVLPTVKEVITANAVFEQALEAKEIRHAGQPSLTQAVTNCDKRAIGSNGGFGFKSLKEGIDISLMDSMILAHWACTRVKKRKKQQVRY
jgi:phage terminase large subunit-like protein